MGELHVTTLTGNGAVLAETDIAAFRARLRGPLLLGGDPGYDEARAVWRRT
jgi:hypothetical protein